jgi:hypothetical protein
MAVALQRDLTAMEVVVDDDWDSPWRIQARIATGQHLAAFVAFANGDPRLNDWQQNFLGSMADILRRMHGRVELSEKQAAVLLRMEDELVPLVIDSDRFV